MKNIVKNTLLYDFYGELLTPKQKNVFKLYYLNDYSLSEIADRSNISKQAVSDLINRTEAKLNKFEKKLKLISKFSNDKKRIKDILKYTEKIKKKTDSKNIIDDISSINNIIKSIL